MPILPVVPFGAEILQLPVEILKLAAIVPKGVGVFPDTHVNVLPGCGRISYVLKPGEVGTIPSTSSLSHFTVPAPQGWQRLTIPHGAFGTASLGLITLFHNGR